MAFYAWQTAKDSKAEGTNTWDELKPSLKPGSGFRELLLFVLFLLSYKLSRYVAIGDENTAFANAYWVVELEKSLGVFYEVEVQQYFMDKKPLLQFLNQIYIKLHIPATIIFFVWLFHKQKAEFTFIRNGFLLANIITIFFFIGFPCAPPRMLTDLGFVDTLLEVSKINLYKGNLSKLFNQYAAMPSMHFGNALLIGTVVPWLHKENWVRWSVMLYPLFVLLVIVITGNHFFADAALGGFLVLAPYPIMWWLAKKFPNLRPWFYGKGK